MANILTKIKLYANREVDFVKDLRLQDDSMTDWDLAFLEALYRDDRAMRRNPAVLATSIASDLARDLRAEQEAAPEN